MSDDKLRDVRTENKRLRAENERLRARIERYRVRLEVDRQWAVINDEMVLVDLPFEEDALVDGIAARDEIIRLLESKGEK